jgi:hypothetical protein
VTVKKCPECNGDVSTRAKVCPHGDAHRSLTNTVALWAGSIVLICIVGVIGTQFSTVAMGLRYVKVGDIGASRAGHNGDFVAIETYLSLGF